MDWADGKLQNSLGRGRNGHGGNNGPEGASDWDRILMAGLVGRGKCDPSDRAKVSGDPLIAGLLRRVEELTASDPDLVFTVGRRGRTWQCGFSVEDWRVVEEGESLASALDRALAQLARL